ncbi:hypothetical protein DFA_10172 [Cavenderia fasciculata]|uniref:Uncharacterized protein n=1 Tax=Cavenderia fasciculata TaxID=261658 RepID=F4Q9G9_CACFS|nr:uncharacterized protein DFA_10172 [Cavenderia fasciculata]EGG15338.1 hypothetical protein DFA_10172 [Cavenderia fasciculata]|eukprot:XP_004352058.1 hypothetical protein DFA_10172 [Cavenderia fasciculata]
MNEPPLEFIQLIERDYKTKQTQKYVDEQVEDVISWLLYLQTYSQNGTILSNSGKLLHVVMKQISNKPLLVDLLKKRVIESTKQVQSEKNIDTIIESIRLVYSRDKSGDYIHRVMIELIENGNGSLFLARMRKLARENRGDIDSSIEIALVAGLKNCTSERIRLASLELFIKIFSIQDEIIPLIMPLIGQAYQAGDMELVDKVIRKLLSNVSKEEDWFTKHAKITIGTFMPILKQPERFLNIGMLFKMLLSVPISDWNHQQQQQHHQLEQFVSLVYSNISSKVKETKCLNDIDKKEKEQDEVDEEEEDDEEQDEEDGQDDDEDEQEDDEEEEDEQDEEEDGQDEEEDEQDEDEEDKQEDDEEEEDEQDEDEEDEEEDDEKDSQEEEEQEKYLNYSDYQQMIKDFAKFLANPVPWKITLEECKRRVVSLCWKDRYVALVIYTKMVPYLAENDNSFGKEFESLLSIFIPTAQDTNPRVRCAFFTFLSQICEDCQQYSGCFVQQLLPSTYEIAAQDPNVNAQSALCGFIEIYLECCFDDSLDSTPDNNLFMALEHLLESPCRDVIESALSSIVSTFSYPQEDDSSHFFSNSIVDKIIVVLGKYQSSREFCHYAYKAIQNFASSNHGKRRFLKNFKSFFQLVNTTKIKKDGVDLFFGYLETCQEVSKILKEDYSIYLAPTMKFVLDIVNQDIVSKTQKTLVISTLESIGSFLNSSESIIYPYLEPLVDACTRLSTTNASRDICKNAISNFDSLLSVCIDRYGNNSQQSKTLYSRLLSCIFDSWSGSSRVGELLEKLRVAKNLTEMMGDYFMTFEQIQDVMSKLWIAKKICFGLLDRTDREKEEDDDEDDDEDDEDDLSYAIKCLYEFVGVLVKKTKEVAIHVIVDMDILSETIQVLHLVQTDPIIKKSILQMFSDICEFGGQPSIALYPQIIPVMIAQNAAFGLGVAAANAKEQFAPYLLTTLTLLKDLVSKKKPRETRSAISAIGKFILHVPQLAPLVRKLIPEWLEKLPIKKSESSIPLLLENAQCIVNLHAIMQLYPNECLGKGDDDELSSNVDQINLIVSEYTTHSNIKNRTKQVSREPKRYYDQLATYLEAQRAF